MTIEDLSPFALQRVTAHEGLAIDAATWTDAHAYHQTAQRLHTRALHGWGIVSGLQVTPVDPPDRGVILQPGVAVDRDGNVIRVPQPVRLALPQGASGTVCCVVRFTEAPVQSGNGTPVSRVNEFFNLLAAPPPIRPSDLEVARIEITSPAAPVRAAASAWEPGAQEIDLRFRRELGLPAADTLRVGQLALGDQQSHALHRRGLFNLVRHLHAAVPFVVQFAGDLRADALVGSCDLLYFAGAGSVKISPKEGAQLIAFLRAGGILFAEPCAEREGQSQENGRFVATFSRLMADLKNELGPLDAEHPVFSARHVFGAPPDGLGGHAPLVGAANVILNPNDYGCCWLGGPPGKPQAREVIRAATEFAENLAWYAAGDPASSARPNNAGKAPARPG